MKRISLAGAVLIAAAAAVVPSLAGGSDSSKQPIALLPDPAQSIPRILTIQRDDTRNEWHLGFMSAVTNVGHGPLIVGGSRGSTSDPTMTARQFVARSDGSIAPGVKIGQLRFVSTPTHNHWHYLGFEKYSLRSAASGKLVSPSRKTGFCLTDSGHDSSDTPLPGESDQPMFTQQCGLNQPDLLQVSEGISVGWTDVYDPLREGQYVDLTHVPAGRYVLVHRVNVDRGIRELDRSNNAASRLIRLTWPDGRTAKPQVKTLATCFSSTRCYDSAPKLTLNTTRAYALRATTLAIGSRPGGVKTTCRLLSARQGTCQLAWRQAGSAWSGTAHITSALVDGVANFRYSVRLAGRPVRCAAGCHSVTRKKQGIERA